SSRRRHTRFSRDWSSDVCSSDLAVGITSWLIFQAVFNVGGVTAAIPFTGITLPFISYGGSSLVVIFGGAGILLNISRQTVSPVRSEERRVGEEWRSRGQPERGGQ